MSSLRKYQKDPKHVISNAVHLFRSSQKKTLVVEGVSDYKFFHQWMDPKSDIRVVDVDGKENVEEVYKLWLKSHKNINDCLYLVADVDYDFIINNKLKIIDDCFLYNFYCKSSNRPLFNDLESFLFNTSALEKLLVNYLIQKDQSQLIRDQVEQLTKIIGCYRAANEILSVGNKKTIIDGLNLLEFCEFKSFSFDVTTFKERLKSYSPRKLDLDEFYDKADELYSSTQPKWFFSRGHDITEILSLYLSAKIGKNIHPTAIELNLRLAANIQTFKKSTVGVQLTNLIVKDGLKFFEDADF